MITESAASEVLLKIDSFEALTVGWSYGEGGPILPEALQIAKRIAINLITVGFTRTDAFPGLSGEARVTAYEGEHYFEFTVEADKSITVLHEVNSVEIEYREGITLNDVVKKIRGYKDLCDLCELSTQNTTTRTSSDFNRSRLSRRLQAAGFRRSIMTAPWWSVPVCATTSINFIAKSPGSHQFTGLLTQTSCPLSTRLSKPRAAPATYATAT